MADLRGSSRRDRMRVWTKITHRGPGCECVFCVGVANDDPDRDVLVAFVERSKELAAQHALTCTSCARCRPDAENNKR
jgi:hypothetical protein